jgi:hypothetical protein
MTCAQDKLLIDRHIQVDTFRVTDKKDIYFLTHAHSDHMKGIYKSFTFEHKGKIHCSQITKDLCQMQINGLSSSAFSIISYNTPYQITHDTKVWAIRSYHCDGSCMFLFEIGQDNERILYTGDFRFHPNMRKNTLLTKQILNKIYYDDTFTEIPIENPYPNYLETFKVIQYTIKKIRKIYGLESTIFINTSILGLEPILRHLGDSLDESFSISPGLKGTYRERQLKYLMPEQLSQNSKLILAHRSKDNTQKELWIIPTCTYFLCLKNQNKSFKPPLNHFYVWFTTHPNNYEIERLKSLTGVIEDIPCKFAIKSLKCLKTIKHENNIENSRSNIENSRSNIENSRSNIKHHEKNPRIF